MILLKMIESKELITVLRI